MKQPGLFENSTNEGESLPLPDANVTYYANWLAHAEADQLLDVLRKEIAWQQEKVQLYGKQHWVPRLQAWHGDPDCIYRYSGLTLKPEPWVFPLLSLKQRCESVTGSRYNSVLLNWYRHGQDSMGLHADNEPELGNQPVIASVTLGAERPFIFKHRTTSQRHSLTLEHGSLLIMAGRTQQYYLHGISKTAKPVGDRINLTFRYIYPQE
ncbi:alpha-ketoglutarate-dependent dioxygenase AlkB family protein [Alteromonas sp. ASW11-130]|uniref:alpha-ketoglutarate-dependent dioxygenase AlkB family protein n=1 Tax=Alteromonas sp. ASW11-130 TaxID=3015775 RepID=UPI00224264F9|nr:alpha-ketoglutarate-dependent dioxygenase AlkB [Alteromonas sp. ASW11-130]MCW8090531.1 alpha-ketoglutarate-dependent dioxygenase AlkB [Alteromonas sp. ASW11-130]